MTATQDTLAEEAMALLSRGLDLCVRARLFDSMDRRAATLAVSPSPEAWLASGRFDEHVARHNAEPSNAHALIHTKSAAPALWALDQYERDLAEWEAQARAFLTKHMVAS